MDPIRYGSTQSPSTQPATCEMGVTVGAGNVAELRQMAATICGAILRIEPVEHASRMKVLLRVPAPLLRKLMEVVMQRFPAAEFGRISSRQQG